MQNYHNSPENGNPDIYWVNTDFINKIYQNINTN
jgi:hypothetical protein